MKKTSQRILEMKRKIVWGVRDGKRTMMRELKDLERLEGFLNFY